MLLLLQKSASSDAKVDTVAVRKVVNVFISGPRDVAFILRRASS